MIRPAIWIETDDTTGRREIVADPGARPFKARDHAAERAIERANRAARARRHHETDATE